jgi:hypothetical protein
MRGQGGRGWARCVGMVLGLSVLLPACSGDGAGPPTTVPAGTTTTTWPWETPPPFLEVDPALGPEQLRAASAYANAEWAALKASADPPNPDLPEFVTLHNPEMLESRRKVIVKGVADGEVLALPTVFKVRVLDVKVPNPTEADLLVCLTTNEVVYKLADGPPAVRTSASYKDVAVLDLIEGHWRLSEREIRQTYEGAEIGGG